MSSNLEELPESKEVQRIKYYLFEKSDGSLVVFQIALVPGRKEPPKISNMKFAGEYDNQALAEKAKSEIIARTARKLVSVKLED